MVRGTIISLQPLQMMPTFARASEGTPTFLRVFSKHLQQYGVSLPFSESDGTYQRWSGDVSVPGKGEIFVWQPRPAA